MKKGAEYKHPQKVCGDAEFLALFEAHGGNETARKLGILPRTVFRRREALERKIGRQLTSPNRSNATRFAVRHPDWLKLEVRNGVVLVGSDAHYWPDRVTTAHKAFVRFCKELKPAVVVMNGDALDGASISRHSPIGWESRPPLIQEIEACKERLGEIELAAGRARKIWTLGNHDGRFETRLATVAPEYARVHGVHLRDHFPLWEPAWSCLVNDSTVIKHRYKGGDHAAHNNTLRSGKSIVTGHLHSLKVTPYTDYNGTRYGVDTGTLADPYGDQFEDYTEQNPVNWRSGFVVLTFRDGRLLWPEVVHVLDEGTVEFRGQVIGV